MILSEKVRRLAVLLYKFRCSLSWAIRLTCIIKIVNTVTYLREITETIISILSLFRVTGGAEATLLFGTSRFAFDGVIDGELVALLITACVTRCNQDWFIFELSGGGVVRRLFIVFIYFFVFILLV